MILQALHDYYTRKKATGDSSIAPEGWIDRPVDFIVEITAEGEALAPICLQETVGRRRRPGPPHRLPNIGKQSMKHSNSGTDANLLWDNAGFALGLGDNGDQKLGRFIKTLGAWFEGINDEALAAWFKFLHRLAHDQTYRYQLAASWPDEESLATG
jgi:CRISPR-associated protein Csd1